MIWTRANHRSSRFVTEDDLFHRVLQICTLVVLATAVLHIRPVKYMSNAGGEISMFVFCLCLCLEDLLEAVKSIEEYYFGIGQRDAVQNASRMSLYNVAFALMFHVPAVILAAMEFFPRSSLGYARRLAATEETSGYEDSSGYGDNDVYGDSKAGYGYKKSTTHVPIALILIGYWVMQISLAIRVIYFFPQNGKHKETYENIFEEDISFVKVCVSHFALSAWAFSMIPINVSFFIHRVGEWTMLMLGECVFSLIIVAFLPSYSFRICTFKVSPRIPIRTRCVAAKTRALSGLCLW